MTILTINNQEITEKISKECLATNWSKWDVETKRCIMIHQNIPEELLEQSFDDFVNEQNSNVMQILKNDQKLSMNFILKHFDKLYGPKDEFHTNMWQLIYWQQLPESYLEHMWDLFKYECRLVRHQPLSETFIEKHWMDILNHQESVSKYQTLSKEFVEKHEHELNLNIIEKFHKFFTDEEKMVMVKKYAEKYNLPFDGEYLIAYKHLNIFDRPWGDGEHRFNHIEYDKLNYEYKGWHCDTNELHEDTFGISICASPIGVGFFASQTKVVKVKIHYKDFGVAVKHSKDGIARVWAFTIIE